MDYYAVTYFRLFHILDKYETYELILACILACKPFAANVPFTISLEPRLAGRGHDQDRL